MQAMIILKSYDCQVIPFVTVRPRLVGGLKMHGWNLKRPSWKRRSIYWKPQPWNMNIYTQLENHRRPFSEGASKPVVFGWFLVVIYFGVMMAQTEISTLTSLSPEHLM